MERVTLESNDFNFEGSSNFGFSALNLDSTLEEHGTLHVPDEVIKNGLDDVYLPIYSAT